MPDGPRTDAHATGTGSETPLPRVVARRTVHNGKKFDFEVVTVRRPDGSTMEREVVRHPGAVVVVPVTDDGRVVLIRNWRVAPERKLLECCAGTLEPPGEDPAVCAGRELIEETGYRAATLTSLGWFYTSPGLSDERMHAFVATGLVHIGQDLEDDETIEVLSVGADEVLGMVDRGEILDGKSIAALLKAERAGLLRPGAGGRG